MAAHAAGASILSGKRDDFSRRRPARLPAGRSPGAGHRHIAERQYQMRVITARLPPPRRAAADYIQLSRNAARIAEDEMN